MRPLLILLGIAIALFPERMVRAQDDVKKENKSAEASQSASVESGPGALNVPLKIGGGAYLWYYDSFTPGARPTLDLYAAYLTLDSEMSGFGLHLEPRFRNTPLRSFFQSNVWVQEVYGYYRINAANSIKAGKIYTQFGYFWDNSFYGNIQYFDGLKLDPEEGVSAEGNVSLTEAFGSAYALQYFFNDGGTNGSLPGRDTISLSGGHKRDNLIARVEPYFRSSDRKLVTLGLSYQNLEADLGSSNQQTVNRYAADAAVMPLEGLKIYGEFSRQSGQTVNNFPITGNSSAHNNYFLVGGEMACGKWTARMNWSYGDYTDLNVQESLLLPGVMYGFTKKISLLSEYAFWTHNESGSTTVVDRSLNLVLYASF